MLIAGRPVKVSFRERKVALCHVPETNGSVTIPAPRSSSRAYSFLLQLSASRCIVSKNKVGRFNLLVTGEAAFHKRRVARFAVCEVTEPPAAGRRVLF
jgi:hypothetical protein